MDNYEVLNILDKSWSKQRLIEKIKRGQSSEEIVQNFIIENKNNLDIVINLLNQKNSNVLCYMEEIANCELNLINELRKKESKSNIETKENIIDINIDSLNETSKKKEFTIKSKNNKYFPNRLIK